MDWDDLKPKPKPGVVLGEDLTKLSVAELEARIGELREKEELAKLRPALDGKAVMRILGLEPGRVIGEALAFLMEIRLDEGEIPEAEAEHRLRAWYAARPESA